MSKSVMNPQKNIMSVDLEDYFCDLPFSEWASYESRIEKTTDVILELFEKYDVTATFFSLGYIAEKFPHLIEKICSLGHEIGSHGYSHLDLRKVSKGNFESDLKKSIQILEKISNEKVLGFRAPFFSVNSKNTWVFDILQKYVKYDSSIFPVRTPLYGIPSAPRFIYKMNTENPFEESTSGNLLEIPPATFPFPILSNIPIAGGFYLRFLPLQIIQAGIKKLNKDQHPAMFYIHPKDLDKDMPLIPEYGRQYYWGLKKSLKKFESILKNFKFVSTRELIENV
jgi:peptidoglycan-N-acetylglucosamine deacetylase